MKKYNMKGNTNMGFFNNTISAKVVDNATQAVKGKLISRFGGFQPMGACTRETDTRTTQELLGNIEYFSERIEEVAQFKKELKGINPKHLGLVSDICELGSRKEMLPDAINLREIKNNGKNVLQLLLEKLPKASKENPETLDFFQEVINQTDSRTSKVFLTRAYGTLEHPEVAKHMTATKPLVKEIAESTLDGGYTMDYSKENNFVNALSSFLNPSVKPENIEVVSETLNAASKLPEKIKLDCYVDGTTILQSAMSPKQMRENLDTFAQIAEGLSKQTKEFNLSDFITHNVNLD